MSIDEKKQAGKPLTDVAVCPKFQTKEQIFDPLRENRLCEVRLALDDLEPAIDAVCPVFFCFDGASKTGRNAPDDVPVSLLFSEAAEMVSAHFWMKVQSRSKCLFL